MTAVLDTPAPVRDVTITELCQAGPGHGLAVLTATVDGDILAVCACGLAAYGYDVDEARALLTAGHP